jgi:hypothetical protein
MRVRLRNTEAMNTKATTLLALVAGFIGGAMSHYLFVPMSVRAQGPAQSSPEIRAQKFVLVDENGMARGVFGFRDDGTPDMQVKPAKPRAGAGVFEVRWQAIPYLHEKPILADLKPTHPSKGH